MLVPARVAIALRCPLCGKTEVRLVSLFAFSGTSSIRLACSCGRHQVAVSRHRGRMVVQVPCYLCDGIHHFEFTPLRFWTGDPEPVICPETGLNLGMMGRPEEVQTWGGLDDEELDPTALADYFINPEVMYEVLAAVHELDEQGRLRCRCGNTDIEYELQPDRLDLVCPRCQSRRSLTATDSADASRARRTRRLEIGAGGQPGKGGRRQ